MFMTNPYVSLPPCRGRWFVSFFCLVCLSGCVRLYKPVYIPTKCNIPKLERPVLSSPLLSANIQALLIYTELLEKDVNFCRGGQMRKK